MGSRRLATTAMDFGTRARQRRLRPTRLAIPSAIPVLGRWKMIDNLRRTLSAPTALIALIAGWMLPFSAALIWTGFVVASIATAPMLPFITGIVPRRLGISKRSHLRAVGTDLAAGLAQIAMLLTLLAHQAWLMTDAIVRTLFRLFVSHRRLLEWVTAAQAKLTTVSISVDFTRAWLAASRWAPLPQFL